MGLVLGALFFITLGIGWVTYTISSGAAAKIELDIQAEARARDQERHAVRMRLIQDQSQRNQEVIARLEHERAGWHEQATNLRDRVQALRDAPADPRYCPVDCIFPPGLWESPSP